MAEQPDIEFSSRELRTVREAMREMSGLLEQLDNGDLDKVVLSTHHRVRAVMLSPARYAELLAAARRADPSIG